MGTLLSNIFKFLDKLFSNHLGQNKPELCVRLPRLLAGADVCLCTDARGHCTGPAHSEALGGRRLSTLAPSGLAVTDVPFLLDHIGSRRRCQQEAENRLWAIGSREARQPTEEQSSVA